MALSILLAMALAARAPAAPVAADDYVGRWNVIITDATDTFVSGGIRIDKTDAGLSGGLVWRSGSYAPVKSVEVVDGALGPWEGEPGPLMLQGDHGKVRFRNIEVKTR